MINSIKKDEQRKENFSCNQSLYFEVTYGMSLEERHSFAMMVLGTYFSDDTKEEFERRISPLRMQKPVVPKPARLEQIMPRKCD